MMRRYERQGPGPSEILPGLYLGAVEDLYFDLKSLKITHVLTVNDELTVVKGGKQLYVKAYDDLDFNILAVLPGCIAFIQEALAAGGKCFVHCRRGLSRSPTVVAAYLMAAEGLSMDAALKHLRERRPALEAMVANFGGPIGNAAFQHQLYLWELMGGKLDLGHPHYRRYALQDSRDLDTLLQHDEKQGLLPVPSEIPPEGQQQGHVLYRCSLCRELLFTARNIVLRECGPGRGVTTWRQWALAPAAQEGASNKVAHTDDLTVFVEPLRWMEDDIIRNRRSSVEGPLHCPGCDRVVGTCNLADFRACLYIQPKLPAFALTRARLVVEEHAVEHPPAPASMPPTSPVCPTSPTNPTLCGTLAVGAASDIAAVAAATFEPTIGSEPPSQPAEVSASVAAVAACGASAGRQGGAAAVSRNVDGLKRALPEAEEVQDGSAKCARCTVI